MGSDCDEVFLVAAMDQAFESRLQKRARSALFGVLKVVCTILLGMGSQGAREDRSKVLVPHA